METEDHTHFQREMKIHWRSGDIWKCTRTCQKLFLNKAGISLSPFQPSIFFFNLKKASLDERIQVCWNEEGTQHSTKRINDIMKTPLYKRHDGDADEFEKVFSRVIRPTSTTAQSVLLCLSKWRPTPLSG